MKKPGSVSNSGDMNDTALLVAANQGHVYVTRLLLDRGAEVYGQRDFGAALLAAVSHQNERVTSLLLQRNPRATWEIMDALKKASRIPPIR